MKTRLLIFLLFVSTLTAGEPPTTVGVPLKVTLAPLTFTAPAGWIDVPVTSPMRKATWRSSPEPDATEIAFFTFGKDQGGTVNENIQRWLGQFSESATKGESAQVILNSRTIHFVRSSGTFSSGMPGGSTTPLPDYALCGAIIETSEGNIFVKMTGPQATVSKLEKTFTELVTDAAKS